MEEEALWTFGRFDPGQVFGTVDISSDAQKRANWEAIYGASGHDIMPRGMVVAAMMESYIRAIQPRPSGNVHAAQILNFTNFRPEWGATLSTVVSCAHKQEKKGRFWVYFGIAVSTGGSDVLTGTIRSIWAK